MSNLEQKAEEQEKIEGELQPKPSFLRKRVVDLGFIGSVLGLVIGISIPGSAFTTYYHSQYERETNKSKTKLSRVANIYNISKDEVDDEIAMDRAANIADLVRGEPAEFPVEINQQWSNYLKSFEGREIPRGRKALRTPEYETFLNDPKVKAYLTSGPIVSDEVFAKEHSYMTHLGEAAYAYNLADPYIRGIWVKEGPKVLEILFTHEVPEE